MMPIKAAKYLAIALPVGCAFVAHVCAAQTLETETARPLQRGLWEVATAYEYQFSSAGSETAVPFAIEYGVRNTLGLLLEPVFYTAIDPSDATPGPHATGIGDLEMTLSYLARSERPRWPALALAGEVKFPTANSSLIGTQRADATAYLIASKRFGNLDTHANVSYAVIGDPPGVQLNNIFGFAVAGEYRSSGALTLFGEVLGNTASSPEGAAGEGAPGENAVAVEAPGAELVGTVGAGAYVRENFFVSFAVSYDNNQAALFRPGFVLRFR